MSALTCPHCGCADPRKHIGHEIRGVYDGVLFWQCGACGLAWARDWTGYGSRRQEIADEYVSGINAGVEAGR